MMNRQILAFAALSFSVMAPAQAQSWDQHLVSGTTDVRLPSGLDATGTVIAFGQPRFDQYSDPEIEDIVRVFEMQGSSFVEVAALQSSLIPATSASYGVALALEGDLLAVGDPAADGVGFVSGAVHIYRRGSGGWTLEQVLQPVLAGETSLLEFGVALDIDDGRLAIGAPTSSLSGLEDGVVFIYEDSTGGWGEVQRIPAPNSALFSGFGRDLELDGDRMIVGVPGGDPLLGPGGLAHIFDHNGSSFVLSATLNSPQSSAGDAFGASVAIDGSLAAVGATGVDISNTNDGRVHVYEQVASVWVETGVLEDVNSRAYNHFGSDLEFEAGSLFISSENTASAQRFEAGPGGWASAERYTTAAGFAWAPVIPVRLRSVAGRVVLTDNEGATVFQRDVPATLEINCEGTPLANPNPAIPAHPVVLDTRGEQSLSERQLPFLLAHGSSIGPGVLFYGFNNASIPFAGGSTLCVAPPVARAGIGGATSGFFSSVTLELQEYPVATGPSSFGPGTTIYMQYWFRVPGGGSFLSSSLEMAFAP